nr:MAG TPA: hypothetical protein [Caudoviricetes sp.]
MSRDELRLLALSYRNIDWCLNLRSRSKSTLSRSKSTLKNRAKRARKRERK